MEIVTGIAVSFILIFILISIPPQFTFGKYGKLLGGFFVFLFIYNFVLMPFLLGSVLDSSMPVFFKWFFWSLSWIVLMQIITFYLLFRHNPLSAIRTGLGAFFIIQIVDWLYPPWIMSMDGSSSLNMVGASIKIDAMVFHYFDIYASFLQGHSVFGVSSDWLMIYFVFPMILLGVGVFLVAPDQIKKGIMG